LRTADKGWSSSVEVGQEATTPRRKETACYEKLYNASELDGLFGTTYATENTYEIWNMEF